MNIEYALNKAYNLEQHLKINYFMYIKPPCVLLIYVRKTILKSAKERRNKRKNKE